MKRTMISEMGDNLSKETLIAGFVETIRDQGKIVFLILRDSTGTVQGVVKKDSPAFEKAQNLTLESVVQIVGNVKEEPQAPGGYEIAVSDLTVLSEAAPELAIPVIFEKSGGEAETSKRLDYRWLSLRRPEKQQIFKTWTYLEEGFRRYFLENNFTQLYPPSFMNAPSEGGADVFEVNYFEEKAYLAQSPQFYKQMAMASGFEKVFMVGPVYRAEPSFTTRHLTEFTGWDFEISYIESHDEIMDLLEDAIVSGFTSLKENVLTEIEVPTQPSARLTMSEVKQKLAENGLIGHKEHDLSPDEERKICELVKDECGHDFVFVTDWHKDARPFYHMRYSDNPQLTKSFDLLYRGLEITTGAQREHRIDVLKKQAEEKGVPLESIADYLKFFEYGCPPHGGAGIGPGRIVMQLLNLPSVKEATFLPRDVKRLNP